MPRVKSADVTAAIDAVRTYVIEQSIANAELAASALAKLGGAGIVVDGVRYAGFARDDGGFSLDETADEDDDEVIPF